MTETTSLREIGVKHTCPDGTVHKLSRDDAADRIVCEHCGMNRDTEELITELEALKPMIVASLTR